MQKIGMTYSFIMDNPNTFGNFLLFVGQANWELKHTLGKKYALRIRNIQAPPNKSCMRQFPPAWYMWKLLGKMRISQYSRVVIAASKLGD